MPFPPHYRPNKVVRRSNVWVLWDAVDVRDGTDVRVLEIPRFAYVHEDFRTQVLTLLDAWQRLPTVGFLRPIAHCQSGRDLYVVLPGGVRRSLASFFQDVPVFPWPIGGIILARVLQRLWDFYSRFDDHPSPILHGFLHLTTVSLDPTGRVWLVPPIITPAYAPAFQYLNCWQSDSFPEPSADPAGALGSVVDTYRVGIIGYFLLTGRWPWVTDELDTPVWVLREPPHVETPWLPMELDTVLQTLLGLSTTADAELITELDTLVQAFTSNDAELELSRFAQDPSGYYMQYRRAMQDLIKTWRFQAVQHHDVEASLWFHEVLRVFDPWIARNEAEEAWVEEQRRVVREQAVAFMGPLRPFPKPAPVVRLREKPSSIYPVWQQAMEDALRRGHLLEAWTYWKRLQWNRVPDISPAWVYLTRLDERLHRWMTLSRPRWGRAQGQVSPKPRPRQRSRRWHWVAVGVFLGILGVIGNWKAPEVPSPNPTPSPRWAVPLLTPPCELTPAKRRALIRARDQALATGDWLKACDLQIQVLACTSPASAAYEETLHRTESICRQARQTDGTQS